MGESVCLRRTRSKSTAKGFRMRHTGGMAWGLIVALSGIWSAAVAAENLADVGGTAELEDRISALEKRLAEEGAESARVRAAGVSYLPSADEAAAFNGYGSGSYGPAVGRDFVGSRGRSSGLYGGAEIMWLKPFASDLSAILLNNSSANEFLPAWRLWGGYQNAEGLGWRVGWWQWDQFSSGSGDSILLGPSDVDQRLVFQKLDLEVTQMASFRRWDLMMSGGVTYVGSQNNFNASNINGNPGEFLNIEGQFNGWGLTAGLLAVRDIPRFAGLSGYGGIQWSGVYGNSNYYIEQDVQGPESIDIDSTMANILELRVGALYERGLGNGVIGFLSGGFEAQYWSGLGGLVYAEVGGADIGLVGFTFGAGIRR